MTPPRLEGRRVVVTGAASGIGDAVVQRLMGEGAHVAALDLRPVNQPVTFLHCDVVDAGSVEQAYGAAGSALGGIDGVVTCAGVTDGTPSDEMPLHTWNRLIAVNLTGTFMAIQAGLPQLLRSSAGSVATIGSVGALVAAGRSAAYDATKGGVLALTRSLAAEYADRGLRLNCVCPGYVMTSLAENSASSGHDPRPTRTPIAGRVTAPIANAATPAQIATVVAFLLSDESSFMTGTVVPVDGGYTAV